MPYLEPDGNLAFDTENFFFNNTWSLSASNSGQDPHNNSEWIAWVMMLAAQLFEMEFAGDADFEASDETIIYGGGSTFIPVRQNV